MGKKVLHLECQSGISGDMTVAALLDLGADAEVLENAVKSLPVDGFEIKIRRVIKSGLDVCDFDVVLDHAHENHDHDMQYLHGHEDHAHHHHEEHIHNHHEDHPHPHTHKDEPEHVHEHRSLPGILHIISHGEMTDHAKELAGRIFGILADAEAKAHGIPRDQVYFHEVGAVDSIVDIVAAAVCLDNLGIDDVVIESLCEGTGTIRCQHGILPVPVPAVMHIVEMHGLPLQRIPVQGELVTPTGAAIAAAIQTSDRLPARYRIIRSGMGAGKRKYECPGILRAMILEEIQEEQGDEIVKLEANIDDTTGEALGYAMECLQKAGARDVHYIPIFMKKNRPAYQLTVICSPEDVSKMEAIMFRETTTIGIRRIRMQRTVMDRRMAEVKTPFGVVRVKECRKGEVFRGYPEYEDLKSICEEKKISYTELYHMVMENWMHQTEI